MQPVTKQLKDAERKVALFGLLDRRERWGLSFPGLAAACAFALVVLGGLFFGVYPFLSVSRQLPTDTLVVEGWISKHAIRAAAAHIQTSSYSKIFATGGPVSGSGPYTNDYNTAARVGYARLLDAGVPAEKLQMVPSRVRDRDRTYSAALALKSWFQSNHVQVATLNVFTESVHARRTRLLFSKALGPQTRVGIIAAIPADYPANRWWRYSEGVKDVLSEGAAYLYARFFFWP